MQNPAGAPGYGYAHSYVFPYASYPSPQLSQTPMPAIMPVTPTMQPAHKVFPALSYTAPRTPEPPRTVYTKPWELVRMKGWWKGHGYASTLRDTPRNPWWKPLATIGVWYLLYTLLSLSVFFFGGLSLISEWGFQDYVQFLGFNTNTLADDLGPTSVLVQFGSIALMLPALWWTVKIFKNQSFGSISSVFGHLRWGAIVKSTLTAGILFTLLNTVSAVVDLLSGAHYNIHMPSLVTLFFAITIVPIQCATEEYIFRGLLIQTMGRWIPRAAHILVPIIPALIFTSLHLYDWYGLSTILSLGLITGYLVMYTGGLEAGIGMHIANNVTIVFFQAFGLYDASAGTDSSVGLLGAIIDISVQLIIAACIVWGAAKKHWFDTEGIDLAGHFKTFVHTTQEKYTQRKHLKQQQRLAAQASAQYAQQQAAFFAAQQAQFAYPAQMTQQTPSLRYNPYPTGTYSPFPTAMPQQPQYPYHPHNFGPVPRP